MRLKELLEGSGVLCPETFENEEVTGVCCDSRKAEAGNLFLCFPEESTGETVYAADAVFHGATVLAAERDLLIPGVPVLQTKDCRRLASQLAARFYGDPSEEMLVFGITGTNGKTSVMYMVQSIMQAAGLDCGVIGTICYDTGKRRGKTEQTTPEAVVLHKILSEMRKDGADCCAMEVSSHGLALSRVADVRFDYGIFTNLTQDHMDFHKGRECYYQAKKKLFGMAGKGICVNADDKAGRRLLREMQETAARQGKKIISYSVENRKAICYGEVRERGRDGSTVRVFWKGRELGELEVRIPGRFMAYNALAAAACCFAAGAPFRALQAGLRALKGIPGRLECVSQFRGVSVYVDYAHTPDATTRVLEAAALIAGAPAGSAESALIAGAPAGSAESALIAGAPAGGQNPAVVTVLPESLALPRIFTVFGCGGDRDREKRPLMGEAAGRGSDYCIVTGDNPRGERQEDIAEEILEGLKKTGCPWESVPDRRLAIRRAMELADFGDLVLVLGKGHEEEQKIGGDARHFSDKEAVLDWIREQKRMENEASVRQKPDGIKDKASDTTGSGGKER